MSDEPVPPPAPPPASMRADARRVYGNDASGYDAGRPDYPERIYEVLASRCGAGPGTTVLEIGPGTGRVTRRLLGLGARVTAVEPDAEMARFLTDAVEGAPVDVVVGTFEEAPLPDGRFDVVVAAMSFHWVDQEIGLPKLHRVLRPGGAVALWWTSFGDPEQPDAYELATAHLLADDDTRTITQRAWELDERRRCDDLARRAGLVDVDGELVRWTVRFDVERLVAFYGTLIAVRRRPEPEQRAVLDQLAAIARSDFGGVVERRFVTALYTARRP